MRSSRHQTNVSNGRAKPLVNFGDRGQDGPRRTMMHARDWPLRGGQKCKYGSQIWILDARSKAPSRHVGNMKQATANGPSHPAKLGEMMSAKALVIAVVAGLAVAACSPLTARSPLFSASDQIGPPPLSTGVWMSVSEHCPASAAQGPLPSACELAELRRLPDGAWILRFREPAHDGIAEKEVELRMLIVAATEHPTGEAYAPLYLAEYEDPTQSPPVRYAAIAPRGVMPATDIRVIADIDCADVLRDGPVTGVSEVRDAHGALVRCIADGPRAVRESVRRAVIENLRDLDENRLVFIHP